MVRRYKRKTNRATSFPADVKRRAVEHYTTNGDAWLQSNCKDVYPGQPYEATLTDKLRNMPDGERLPSNLSVGFSRHMQVFNTEHESKLADYLKHAAKIYFGLSPNEFADPGLPVRQTI